MMLSIDFLNKTGIPEHFFRHFRNAGKQISCRISEHRLLFGFFVSNVFDWVQIAPVHPLERLIIYCRHLGNVLERHVLQGRAMVKCLTTDGFQTCRECHASQFLFVRKGNPAERPVVNRFKACAGRHVHGCKTAWAKGLVHDFLQVLHAHEVEAAQIVTFTKRAPSDSLDRTASLHGIQIFEFLKNACLLLVDRII